MPKEKMHTPEFKTIGSPSSAFRVETIVDGELIASHCFEKGKEPLAALYHTNRAHYAPELLEALEEALKEMVYYDSGSKMLFQDQIAKARLAVKKSKGEA